VSSVPVKTETHLFHTSVKSANKISSNAAAFKTKSDIPKNVTKSVSSVSRKPAEMRKVKQGETGGVSCFYATETAKNWQSETETENI
jgi:hypothetical protein